MIPIKTRIHSDHFQVGGKPIIDDVQDDLYALGHEGWELVSIQDVSLPDGRMFTIAYFKGRKGGQLVGTIHKRQVYYSKLSQKLGKL